MRKIKQKASAFILATFYGISVVRGQGGGNSTTSPFPTVTTDQVTTPFRTWGLAAINVIIIVACVGMGIKLYQAVHAVQTGKADSSDKAWAWGAGLAFFVVGGIILNLFVGKWGGGTP